MTDILKAIFIKLGQSTRLRVFLIFVLMAFVFWVATPAHSEEPEVILPIKCDKNMCVMPRQTVQDMMDAHNAMVDEIRKLTKDCDTKKSPRLKTENNT